MGYGGGRGRRYTQLRPRAQPVSQIYEVGNQRHENTPNLVVRTASDPARLAAAMRAAVRAVDNTAVISKVTTMEQRLGEQTA